MYSRYSLLNTSLFIYIGPLLDRIANFERHYLFIPLNTFAFNYAWAGQLALFFGEYAIYFILLSVFVWAFLERDRIKATKALLVAALSFILARLVFTEIIRLLFPRSRPFVNWVVHLLIVNESGPGFPSGHTVALAAIATGIYFYNKKFGLWLLVLAALVGLGRMISGVHYPTDILGGLVVGIISAWLVKKFIALRLNSISIKISNLWNRILPFTKR